ncbi:hypothetical protein [Bacillus cereus group sp. N24]|uniref:hypothetical protein n=1 Tax=Bacillus cereus group sp. N24 TaxID=2794592 RepID=UPI0018F71733|nr:hypothetical protein [Bacillus cereus group sp. N24]MBJ7950126.1 hypothetical protein [Bacillus cereus group sp. N24]
MSNSNTDSSNSSNRNHDGIFKKLLYLFFEDYIDFTQPSLKDHIDFTKVDALDTHVSQPKMHKKKGTDYYVDAAFRTIFKGKSVIFHIEAQSYNQTEFPERMFNYFHLCRKTYKCDIFSNAVCFNENQKNIPNYYEYKHIATNEVSCRFDYDKIDLNSYKLADHKDTHNMFALATLGLMDGYNKLDSDEKIELKLQSYIKLFNKKFDDEKKYIISACFEMYMLLNNEELKQFNEKLKEADRTYHELEAWVMEAAKNNDFIRTVYEEGEIKGEVKGMIKLLRKQHANNKSLLLKQLSDENLSKLTETNIELVREVKREILPKELLQ